MDQSFDKSCVTGTMRGTITRTTGGLNSSGFSNIHTARGSPPQRAVGRSRQLVKLSYWCQAQPSSFMAQGAFHIFVMWRILSPSNSMT
jgi:hypothetical protein